MSEEGRGYVPQIREHRLVFTNALPTFIFDTRIFSETSTLPVLFEY